MLIELSGDDVDLIHCLLDLAAECWDMKKTSNGSYPAADAAYADGLLDEGRGLVQRCKAGLARQPLSVASHK